MITRYALEHHLKETIDYLVKSYHGLSEIDILRRARLKALIQLRRSRCPSTDIRE